MTTPATDTGDQRRFVLATKVTPPPIRPEHIDRARLFAWLDVATNRPLTLVAAPTGFGKTTLMSAWARRGFVRTAWLTITAGDADTVRLTSGIVAALHRAGALKDEDIDRALAAPGIDVVNRILPRLLAALEDADPIVLILDDYHVMSGAEAQHVVETLVADAPTNLRVVIATRADPVLPLGRLRATGALVELRSDQLRFDLDEAERFLNGSLGLDLDRASLETLEARTEGWPAGLYLAALSLRARSDRARFVAEFAGSSRHVVDYLSAEVLDGLQPDDRAFLLRASILGRLGGPVCDAVTGMTGSAARLRDLERANLFIVPLDESGTWFRFHRLFAQLLQSQLADEHPDLVADLHHRAADWHADHGLIETAVEHALAAGDRELAGTLVARTWREFTRTGQSQTLERLVAAIGSDGGRMAGPLALVEAIAAGLLGRDARRVERLVAIGRASGWEGPTPDGRSIDSLAAIATASFGGLDLERQEAAARHLVEGFAGDEELANIGWGALGILLVLKGDAGGALASLEQVTDLSPYPNIQLWALASRSLALGELGDPTRAESIAKSAVARAEGFGLAESRPAGAVWLALGSANAQLGRPREALPHLERALATWGVPGTLYRAQTLILLASVYGEIGGAAQARAAAREAREIVESSPDAGALPMRLAAVEKRLRTGAARVLSEGDRPSEAEIRVLRLLASSMSAREIAAELFVSINTVKTHTAALHQKLGTSSRETTVARARDLGLL